MTTVVIGFLGVMMVIAALFALYQKNLVATVISAGAVSLLGSVVYLFLDAPDVAMTEAAIGSALTTMVFLYALRQMKEDNDG